MPIVEFKKHPVSGGMRGSKIPDFIRGSADYHNPTDDTYVGWVADNRDFYLPDSIVVLDKASFTARMLAIHAVQPMNNAEPSMESEPVPMTEAEVTAFAEETYDRIVAHCRSED
jgi:hypothetical protein